MFDKRAGGLKTPALFLCGRKMRSTQFIGLTKKAQEFVKNLEELPSDGITKGMFLEDIPLRRWTWPVQIHLTGEERQKRACVREVVQATPWSSGPMIFTCLEMDWGFSQPSRDKVLFWVPDPTLGFKDENNNRIGPEYDEEQGIFWV